MLKKERPLPSKAGEAKSAATGEDKSVSGSMGKIYDRISSVVVEEINHGHILLRGRKNLIYKQEKHLIELQALVSRRDISYNDTISSDDIIEYDIAVVK